MSITIQWLGHASFKMTGAEAVVYIDPWKLSESPKDASMVLVSHSHYDHYSAEDIRKVSGPQTRIIGPADVAGKEKNGQVLEPGRTIKQAGVKITGVASYNPAKQFHPRANNWLGFVIEIGSTKIYYAGDTDIIDEMNRLENIYVALLPVGGTYTMDAAEAAEAVGHIKPKYAVPYHWGDIVGSRADAEQFAKAAQCEVKILSRGEAFEF